MPPALLRIVRHAALILPVVIEHRRVFPVKILTAYAMAVHAALQMAEPFHALVQRPAQFHRHQPQGDHFRMRVNQPLNLTAFDAMSLRIRQAEIV